MLEGLKKEVLQANLDLVSYNLVSLTWGNVSGIDRGEGLFVIKPSGVEYKALKVDDLVVVDLDGRVVEGDLNPSSDTPTHLELYKAFPGIGGITHSHSEFATTFCQANKEIPCLGTTHADHFYGPIPLTRILTAEETESAYEKNTGKVIIERFRNLEPMETPAVLVAGHAPFTWGESATDSVKNNFVLERVAKMTLDAMALNPNVEPLPDYVLKKHYERKHGPNAYYGQKK